VKPVRAGLSQLEACSQYFHLQKVHFLLLELSLFLLRHHLLLHKKQAEFIE
jgi:hypothetical protein